VLLILNAADGVSERTDVAAYTGIFATEAKAAGGGTIHRTRPIVTAGANIVERTNSELAVARHGQFKGRSESPGGVVAAPT